MNRHASTLTELLTAISVFLILTSSVYVSTICRHGLDARLIEEKEMARHLLDGLEERLRLRSDPASGSPATFPSEMQLPAGHGLVSASATVQLKQRQIPSPRPPAPRPRPRPPTRVVPYLEVVLVWTSADGTERKLAGEVPVSGR